MRVGEAGGELRLQRRHAGSRVVDLPGQLGDAVLGGLELPAGGRFGVRGAVQHRAQAACHVRVDADRIVEGLDALDGPTGPQPGHRRVHLGPGLRQLQLRARPLVLARGLGPGDLHEVLQLLPAGEGRLVQDGSIDLQRGLVPGGFRVASGLVGRGQRRLQS